MCWDHLIEPEQQTGVSAHPLPAAPSAAQAGKPAMEPTVLPEPLPAEPLACVAAAAGS